MGRGAAVAPREERPGRKESKEPANQGREADKREAAKREAAKREAAERQAAEREAAKREAVKRKALERKARGLERELDRARAQHAKLADQLSAAAERVSELEASLQDIALQLRDFLPNT